MPILRVFLALFMSDDNQMTIFFVKNAILRTAAFDLERVRNMLGERKGDDAIAMAKHLE